MNKKINRLIDSLNKGSYLQAGKKHENSAKELKWLLYIKRADKEKYVLDTELIDLKLPMEFDALEESSHEFKSLEELLQYTNDKFGIGLEDFHR